MRISWLQIILFFLSDGIGDAFLSLFGTPYHRLAMALPTVFVTGGSGFVGRTLVRMLITHGYRVKVMGWINEREREMLWGMGNVALICFVLFVLSFWFCLALFYGVDDVVDSQLWCRQWHGANRVQI